MGYLQLQIGIGTGFSVEEVSTVIMKRGGAASDSDIDYEEQLQRARKKLGGKRLSAAGETQLQSSLLGPGGPKRQRQRTGGFQVNEEQEEQKQGHAGRTGGPGSPAGAAKGLLMLAHLLLDTEGGDGLDTKQSSEEEIEEWEEQKQRLQRKAKHGGNSAQRHSQLQQLQQQEGAMPVAHPTRRRSSLVSPRLPSESAACAHLVGRQRLLQPSPLPSKPRASVQLQQTLLCSEVTTTRQLSRRHSSLQLAPQPSPPPDVASTTAASASFLSATVPDATRAATGRAVSDGVGVRVVDMFGPENHLMQLPLPVTFQERARAFSNDLGLFQAQAFQQDLGHFQEGVRRMQVNREMGFLPQNVRPFNEREVGLCQDSGRDVQEEGMGLLQEEGQPSQEGRMGFFQMRPFQQEEVRVGEQGEHGEQGGAPRNSQRLACRRRKMTVSIANNALLSAEGDRTAAAGMLSHSANIAALDTGVAMAKLPSSGLLFTAGSKAAAAAIGAIHSYSDDFPFDALGLAGDNAGLAVSDDQVAAALALAAAEAAFEQARPAVPTAALDARLGATLTIKVLSQV